MNNTWVAWHKANRRRWRVVGEAPTERAAWTLLLKQLDLLEPGSSAVLPAGRHPNDPLGTATATKPYAASPGRDLFSK